MVILTTVKYILYILLQKLCTCYVKRAPQKYTRGGRPNLIGVKTNILPQYVYTPHPRANNNHCDYPNYQGLRTHNHI